MILRAACAQLAPEKGRPAANLDRIAEAARQAQAEGADLVAFPESIVTGYFLEGGVIEHAMPTSSLVEELAARLTDLTDPLDLVVGFYEVADGILYNSAAYVECVPGSVRTVHVHRKFFLPTYGMFDEARFVAEGREIRAFDTRFGRVGLLICEDVWHSITSTLLALDGAQIIVVPSASPARGFETETIGNLDRYRRMIRALCEEHGVFGLNPMLAGFEGGKGFVGGSRIVDPFGLTLGEAVIGDEALLIADLDFEDLTIARAQSPLLADLRTAWPTLRDHARNLP